MIEIKPAVGRVLRCLAVALAFHAAASAPLLGQVKFTVNSLDDADDGLCDVAHCSLREALDTANTVAGTDTIDFSVAGTISPDTPLPRITGAVRIDGGLAITLDGSSTAPNDDGLEVTSTGGGSTIRGLVIHGFSLEAGVRLSSGNNVVAGNRIGTDAAGTSAIPNLYGVQIDAGGGNVVGGTTAADRNIISGNSDDGVRISSTASGTMVLRNYIGVDVTGAADLGNGGNGVHLLGVNGNQIGTAADGNVISGNERAGVLITGTGSNGNFVEGNVIGTDAARTGVKLGNGNNNGGATKFPGVRISSGAHDNTIGDEAPGGGNVVADNRYHGIEVEFGAGTGNRIRGNLIGTLSNGTTQIGNANDGVRAAASQTQVGGTVAGEGNTIAFNGDDGASVLGPVSGVSIQRNSIYDNSDTGIDLRNDGVTANDAGDGDTGENGLQNFPVLSWAVGAGGIAGTLNSGASKQFRLEFFSSPTCDPSGNGEGKTFLGFSNQTTEASGNVSFHVSFGALTLGHFITATATDNVSNTSEFSACVTVVQGADIVVTKSGPASVDAATQIVYTLTIQNNGPQTATNVVIADSLPATVTYLASSDGGSLSSRTVTWPVVASIASGANVQRTVTVTAPPTGVLTNIARASDSSGDPDITNNDGSNAGARVTTTVTERADVGVTKTGPAAVNAGTNFTYTLTVKNDGPSTAANVLIADSLPASVTYVISSDGGLVASRTVTWPVVTIAAGDSVQRTVTVTAPGTGTLTNIARASATTSDLNPTNNDGTNVGARTTTTVLEPADVEVKKSGPTTVDAGSQFTYTLTVKNHGPGAARDVVIADSLPATATYVSSSDIGSLSSRTVTWPTVVSIAVGDSVQRTVTVNAPGAGPLTNIARAATFTIDPDASNNDGTNADARVTTSVTPRADVEVTKSGPASVPSAANFTYTLTVTNHGPSVADDVAIADSLPADVTYVSSSDLGSLSSRTVTWSAVTIPPGNSVQRTVTVTAPATGLFTNIGRAAATTVDPDATNNDGTNAGARVTTMVQLYSLSASPPSASTPRGEDATYFVTVNPATTFSNPVTFSCAGLPAGASCAFSPPVVTPGANDAFSTLTVSTVAGPPTPIGVASFDIVATSGSVVEEVAVDLDITKDFAVTVSPATQTVDLGGAAAVFTVTVEDSGFYDNAVTLSCSDLPAGVTCAFNPSTVTPNGADAPVELRVTASAAASGLPGGSGKPPWWISILLISLALSFALARVRRETGGGLVTVRRRLATAIMVLLFACVGVLAACSEDPFDIPDITSPFTITGTAGSDVHSTTATITVRR